MINGFQRRSPLKILGGISAIASKIYYVYNSEVPRFIQPYFTFIHIALGYGHKYIGYIVEMTRRGNPDFGTKYRFDYGREEPLSEQVKVLMHPTMKNQLKNLAELNKCTVPDVIREAIDKYLDSLKKKDAN